MPSKFWSAHIKDTFPSPCLACEMKLVGPAPIWQTRPRRDLAKWSLPTGLGKPCLDDQERQEGEAGGMGGVAAVASHLSLSR